MTAPEPRGALRRGGLLRVAYRLGRQAASGVLTVIVDGARPEVFVLRRGAIVCGDGELARRAISARLSRLAAEPVVTGTFDGTVTAYPPGAAHQVALADWVRSHLEAQLDTTLADLLLHELSNTRLSLRPDLAPAPLDESDRRMLAALDRPRRLDQIWPLARTPRFRLLAFLHFLRAVGALATDAVAQSPANPRHAAQRLLGVDATADADAVKRAYRRLARTLHPDLHPDADAQRRRTLELRFAELTAAYESLT